MTERQAGIYSWDVLVRHPGPAYDTLIPAGLLDPVRPALMLPEVLDDNAWLGGVEGGALDKDKKYTFAFQASVGQNVYINRDFVSEADLGRMEQLIDPRWSGKQSWFDPRTQSNGATVAGVMTLVFGEDFLRKLWGQDVTITRDARQQIEWLVRGRYPIAFGIQNSTLPDFLQAGLGKNVKPLDPDSRAGSGSASALARS